MAKPSAAETDDRQAEIAVTDAALLHLAPNHPQAVGLRTIAFRDTAVKPCRCATRLRRHAPSPDDLGVQRGDAKVVVGAPGPFTPITRVALASSAMLMVASLLAGLPKVFSGHVAGLLPTLSLLSFVLLFTIRTDKRQFSRGELSHVLEGHAPPAVGTLAPKDHAANLDRGCVRRPTADPGALEPDRRKRAMPLSTQRLKND